MDIGHWITDINPAAGPDGGAALARLAATEAALIGVLLAAGLALYAAFHAGRRAHRRWVAARLRSFAEAHVLSGDAIRAGMRAIVEVSGPNGVRRLRAEIGSAPPKTIGIGLREGDGTVIPVGAPIRVTVLDHSSALRFQTIVQDRRLVGQVPTVFVPRPEWVEKVQRRSFFRVPVQLATAVTWRGEEAGSDRLVSGVIDDLSAGGFRLALPMAVEPGTRITVRLPIVALTGATFEARILRCATDGRPTTPLPFRAHCEFLWISEETRSLLVGYCFDVQREWLRTRAISQ